MGGAAGSAPPLRTSCVLLFWSLAGRDTFKWPRYIRFVTDFPITVTGKVQKFKMREIAMRGNSACECGVDQDA